MKKIMMSILTLVFVGGTASAVDTAKLTTAILGLVGSLAGNIPPIITEIQKFPVQAKAQADKMRQAMLALNAYRRVLNILLYLKLKTSKETREA
jgi:ribosomal protein S3